MAKSPAVEAQVSSRSSRASLVRVACQLAIDGLLIGLVAFTAWRLIPAARQAMTKPLAFDLDPPVARVGSRALSPGVFAAGSRNIVLAVSSTCPVSRNSLGLYRALSSFAEDESQWELVVLGAKNEQWVRNAGINGRFIDDPLQVSIWATPTLMIVNDEGIITDILVGFVKAQVELRLWNRLDRAFATPPLDNSVIPKRVTQSEFEATRTAAGFQLVDFRPRSLKTVPRPDAFHIPLSEVSLRAGEVLSRDRPVLIDCSISRINEAECLVAAIPFRESGFRDVSMLVKDRARERP